MLQKPYKGNGNYIFISYAHRNIDQVMGLIETLQKNGYNVWYDEGIDPATEWDENIAKHIRNCSFFIAFITKDYMNSQNCKDEVYYARDLNKERLIIYGEEVELTDGMKMRLGRLQAVFKYKYKSEQDFYEKVFDSPGIADCRESGFVGDAEVVASSIPDKVKYDPAPPKKKTNITSILIIAAVILAIIGGIFAFINSNKQVGPYSESEVSNGILGKTPAINVIEGQQNFVYAKERTTDSVYDNKDIVIKDEQGFWILTDFRNNNPDKAAVAKDVRLKVSIEKISDTRYDVTSYITCPNGKPKKQQDTLTFTSNEPFELQYVPGSSYVYSHFDTAQLTMAPEGDSVYGDGILVGYDAADGIIPGGAYVTSSIEVKVIRN